MNDPNSYNGNPRIKRDGVSQQYTRHELEEYVRCFEDPIYFINNYVKVINLNDGLVLFTLRGYQTNMIKHINANRFSCILSGRQSGKSITSIAYILWYICFSKDKTVAILANKGAIAREMLSRLTLMLESLPFFLQPGCKVLNKGSIEFSNNSKVVAAATSGSSIRGLSISLLLLDEFAFVNDAETFFTSTYPTISSGKNTKVIVTSTPNGVGNMFYRIWQAAVNNTSEFKPLKIDWWEVPGRDEAWKKLTISNTSELQFAQEYSCDFLGSSNTLISSNILLGLKAGLPLKTHNDVKYYHEPKEGHNYIMLVDVSKGRGQDYSTFNVIDTTTTPFQQAAVYRNNNISPLLYPDIIVRVAKVYNEALVMIENNDAGHIVCNAVYHEYEYENTFVESAVKALGVGVTMTKRVKRIGCSNLKDIVESGKLQIDDLDTIAELSSFEAKGGSYEASGNTHDDLVMNLVLFSWFISTDMFQESSSVNLKDLLFSDRLKEMEDDVIPFGIMHTEPEMTADMSHYLAMIEAQKEWGNL